MAFAMFPTHAKASSEGLPLRGAIYKNESTKLTIRNMFPIKVTVNSNINPQKYIRNATQ